MDIDFGDITIVLGILLVIGVIFTGLFFIAIVPAGTVGIQDTFGNVAYETLPSGFHFKSPITGVYPMDIKTKKYSAVATSASKDLQDVRTELTLNYRVNALNAVKMYKEVGVDFEDKVVVPAIQEALKSSTAKFTADDLIQKRENVKQEVEAILTERLKVYNLIVETVSLTDFKFSEKFTEAIEAKQTAEVEVNTAKNLLERIKVEKEQTITQAEALAVSKKLNADADAYALKIIREELEKSQELIDYKAVEKWDGTLPKYVGGGAMPFINVE
jgi:regulator of protease activity HflC (stomatin/prohibitin superfamily)